MPCRSPRYVLYVHAVLRLPSHSMLVLVLDGGLILYSDTVGTPVAKYSVNIKAFGELGRFV